jgi:hypothetical protein
MFAEPTVFLLGAGASWHYGYPTGEDLVKKIIQKADHLQKYLEFSAQTNHGITPDYVAELGMPNTSITEKWHTALGDCRTIKARLEQVSPLVIDYFLGWNPKLQSVGRLLIAWVILECENLYENNHGNINRREALINSPLEPDRIRANNISLQKYKGNWCRFIIHQMAIGCKNSPDISRNALHFVTFNYDASLERALSNGLSHIELFQRGDIESFLSGNRITHIYGKVRKNPFDSPAELNWSEQGRNPKDLRQGQMRHLYDYKKFLDEIHSASREIRVIDPDDKETDKAALEFAASAIENARYVYVLGYGFDENNSARLRLRESLNSAIPTKKSVFFTNYGDVNRINKRASRLFFGNDSHFSSGAPHVEYGNVTYFEKSYRDAYEAIELDFDVP